MSTKQIMEIAADKLPSFVNRISVGLDSSFGRDQVSRFIQRRCLTGCAIIFTDKEDVSPVARALSIRHQPKLTFLQVVVPNTSSPFLEQFGLEPSMELPQLLFVKGTHISSLRVNRYSGKMTVMPMSEFLQKTQAM